MSFPGIAFIQFLLALGIVGLLAVVWLIRLIGAVVMRSRAEGRLRLRVSPWYLLAPILGALVLALAFSTLPMRVRWSFSRAAFAKIAAEAPPATSDWQDFDVPNRIGSYSIDAAVRIPQGVLFYEAHGSFLNDAGFAYLPSGPSGVRGNGSFEDPQFDSLGGPWYAWSASW